MSRWYGNGELVPGDVVAGGWELVERVHVMESSSNTAGKDTMLLLGGSVEVYMLDKDENVVTPWKPAHLWGQSSTSSLESYRYYALGERFDKGKAGEVWRATRTDGSSQETFILKRILDPNLRQSGFREIHFGQTLRHSNIARFIEWFEEGPELWLVFYDEGTSLKRLLYSFQSGMQTPSSTWFDMKQAPDLYIVPVLRDIAQGILACHEKHVLHRDIKPGNVVVGQSHTHLITKLIDFGISVDQHSVDTLYAPPGPQREESTIEYAPPEVRFGQLAYSNENPSSFDAWSFGVLILEVIIGSSNVFQVQQREWALFQRHLPANLSDEMKDTMYALKALTDYCIYQSNSESDNDASLDTEQCSIHTFIQHITDLDPLHLGFPSMACAELTFVC